MHSSNEITGSYLNSWAGGLKAEQMCLVQKEYKVNYANV